MKFLHIADAHLDSPFRGLSFLPSGIFNQIHNAANISFEKLIDTALAEKVDLVLIAGDTFDSTHPSPKSQLFFAKQIQRLTDAGIQVVMIFGNHDYMDEHDLLITPSPYFKIIGNGETIESIEFKTNTGFPYVVNGFSYAHNHIESDKAKEFPQKSQEFTFGLMHAGQRLSRGNNVYAPFSLSELQNLNYNYFALGHIHVRQIISESPLIAYAGNIQGRHINETGPKGGYLGIVDEKTKHVELKFIATSPIVWKNIKLTLTAPIAQSELKEKIVNTLNAQLNQTTFISLIIKGAQYLDDKQDELLKDPNFWQNVSREIKNQSQLVDVRFIATQEVVLNENDQQALERAKVEIYANKNLTQATQALAKKSDYLTVLLADNDFRDRVQDLTNFKIIQQLKGLHE